MDPERVNPLVPFPLWLAFPTAEYDVASAADTLHRWTAHLPVSASHVHDDDLCKVASVAVSIQPNPLFAESRTETG